MCACPCGGTSLTNDMSPLWLLFFIICFGDFSQLVLKHRFKDGGIWFTPLLVPAHGLFKTQGFGDKIPFRDAVFITWTFLVEGGEHSGKILPCRILHRIGN